MNILQAGRLAPVLLLAALWPEPAPAGHAVLIWPVDPVISGDRPATELWVENRGESTTLLQVRVFAWQQIHGREQYQTQRHVLPSPAMVRLEAGQKQLIRLIKQASPVNNGELAYRVLLDEIPTPYHPDDQNAHALNFQMRYSIPLFVYGPQGSPDKGMPLLSWRRVTQAGESYLEITNRGPVHARLSKARLGGQRLTDGLLGYVLAHSSNRWPLSVKVPAQAQLEARVDNRDQVWRSSAADR